MHVHNNKPAMCKRPDYAYEDIGLEHDLQLFADKLK